ncbi:mCG14572 [Mus musculus]|nr:mCG14572 [Mus musculus]
MDLSLVESSCVETGSIPKRATTTCSTRSTEHSKVLDPQGGFCRELGKSDAPNLSF